jgi:hypothetical protein
VAPSLPFVARRFVAAVWGGRRLQRPPFAVAAICGEAATVPPCT